MLSSVRKLCVAKVQKNDVEKFDAIRKRKGKLLKRRVACQKLFELLEVSELVDEIEYVFQTKRSILVVKLLLVTKLIRAGS